MQIIRLTRQKSFSAYTIVGHNPPTTGRFRSFLGQDRFAIYSKLNNRNFCSKINCWNCSKIVNTCDAFFCCNCGKVLEARTNDYFKLMSLKEQFDINTNELTKRYRELQVLVHPDKYFNRDEKERKNSMEWSALLNKAYQILSNPLERGEYILNQKGIILSHDNSMLDPDFLLEIMEKNEEIEQADHKSLVVHLTKTRATLNTLCETVGSKLNKENYHEAKHVLVKMKYYKSLEETIKEKIHQMEYNLG